MLSNNGQPIRSIAVLMGLTEMFYNAAMRLITLGQLQLEGSTFTQPKALLLLGYLAIEGAQSRRMLAELFFSDTKHPRDALSTTFRRLKQLGDAVVEAEGDRLATKLACDAIDLLHALDAGEIESTLTLYEGPFLKGLDLSLGEELEEWLYSTREFLAARMREGLLRLGEDEATKEQFKNAAKYAEQAYLLKSAPEPNPEDLQRLYQLFLEGKSSYLKDIQKEAESYGLTLEKPQVKHMPAVEQNGSVSSAASIPHNLPNTSTSLVGRDLELVELIQVLSQDDCHLLTLTGLGGMGKTRLALQLAREVLKQQLFPDGVYFIPLEALVDSANIPTHLESILPMTLNPQVEPLEQVKSFLKTKQLLLVLDNYEHLLEAADLPSELINSCPELKLLITSREALKLREEQVYPLEGLSYQHSPDDSFNEQTAIEAVQLFLASTKRVHLRFKLTPETLPYVEKICELVRGSPLGIELAATWVRVLPLEDIVRDLEKGLDLLSSSTRNMTERHQSIRAAFEHSWKLLTPKEQEVLSNLSVFHGGFKRAAAAEVVGATLPVLASLVDKSLLSLTAKNRYEQHPLVIQYSLDKLKDDPEEKQLLEEKHATYFLHQIRPYASKLRSLERKKTLLMLVPDFPNIKRAWLWMLKQNHVEVLAETSQALSAIFGDRPREAEQLFAQVIDTLDKDNPKHQRALAYALVLKYKNRYVLAASRPVVQQGLKLFRELDDKRGIIMALKYAYYIFDDEGNGLVQSPFLEGLALARQYGRPEDIGNFLERQMRFEMNHLPFQEVNQHFQEALKEVQELKDSVSIAHLLLTYGSYLVNEKELDKGLKLLQECRDLNEQLGIFTFDVSLDCELGVAAFKSGDHEQAQIYFEQALTKNQNYHADYQAKSLSYLAKLAVLRGDQAKALRILEENLKLNASISARLASLISVAAYVKAYVSPSQAVESLQFVYDHLNTEKRDRVEALIALKSIKSKLDHATFQAAVMRSQSLDLEELIQDALSKVARHRHQCQAP